MNQETGESQDRVAPSRWQSLVEEKIAAAREQGEFDDLPGQGEPLCLKENPLAGEWELAFHVLENAEMAPPWMEMSREIREGETDLSRLIERTNAFMREQVRREQPRPHVEQRLARERESGPWWWPFQRRDREVASAAPMTVDLTALEAERNRARREYLERAARVDELIAAYNAWLPDNLRRLQKPRLPASRAAQRFDAGCPALERDAP